MFPNYNLVLSITDGKFLKCWALRGMPKLWRYRPEPMKKFEKYLMLFFGSFIDLFPLVGTIWGIVWFAKNPTEKVALSIVLFIVSGILLLLMIIFGEVIIKKGCKKCANFSCSMNNVPEEIINQFLEKNPKIKDAWEKSLKEK